MTFFNTLIFSYKKENGEIETRITAMIGRCIYGAGYRSFLLQIYGVFYPAEERGALYSHHILGKAAGKEI